MTQRDRTLIGLGALVWPITAAASDYSGLPILLYGGFGVVFAIVFTVVWHLTREIPRHWLRTLVRCATVAIFWAPIDLGTGRHTAWWPVSCYFLEPSKATEAPASILATTLLLWCFVMCLPRAPTTAGK